MDEAAAGATQVHDQQVDPLATRPSTPNHVHHAAGQPVDPADVDTVHVEVVAAEQVHCRGQSWPEDRTERGGHRGGRAGQPGEGEQRGWS